MTESVTVTFDGFAGFGKHNFVRLINEIFQPKINGKTCVMEVVIDKHRAYCNIRPALFGDFISQVMRAVVTNRSIPFTISLRLIPAKAVLAGAPIHKVRPSSLMEVAQNVGLAVRNRCLCKVEKLSNIRVAFDALDMGLDITFRAKFTREQIEERVRRAIAIRDRPPPVMVDASTQVTEDDFSSDESGYISEEDDDFQLEMNMAALSIEDDINDKKSIHTQTA